MSAPATHPIVRCDRPACSTLVERHVKRCASCRRVHGPVTPFRAGVSPTSPDALLREHTSGRPSRPPAAMSARRPTRALDVAEAHGGDPQARMPGTGEGCSCGYGQCVSRVFSGPGGRS